MKRISRKEAESIFQKFHIVSSKVEQDQQGLRISMLLENQDAFIVQYDTLARTKQYFLNCGC